MKVQTKVYLKNGRVIEVLENLTQEQYTQWSSRMSWVVQHNANLDEKTIDKKVQLDIKGHDLAAIIVTCID